MRGLNKVQRATEVEFLSKEGDFFKCGEQGHLKKSFPKLKGKKGKSKEDNSMNIFDTCSTSVDGECAGEV